MDQAVAALDVSLAWVVQTSVNASTFTATASTQARTLVMAPPMTADSRPCFPGSLQPTRTTPASARASAMGTICASQVHTRHAVRSFRGCLRAPLPPVLVSMVILMPSLFSVGTARAARQSCWRRLSCGTTDGYAPGETAKKRGRALEGAFTTCLDRFLPFTTW